MPVPVPVPRPSSTGWIDLGGARIRFTGRAEGDLGHAGTWVAVDGVDPGVAARRRSVLDVPWSWVRQVHGDTVVVVDGPGGGAGQTGDAVIAAAPGAALAILTADCAPIAMVADNGLYGAVHAGWKGLQAGIVQRAADAMRDMGAGAIEAVLGPCIHAECYEFGEADLAPLVATLGHEVRGTTASGAPALDVPAAVRAALAAAGVDLVGDVTVCTACSPDHYSYRAAGDMARQALVVHRPA